MQSQASFDLEAITKSFNAAAVDSSLWEDALESVSAATGSHGALIISATGLPPRTHATASVVDPLKHAIKTGWQTRDPRLQAAGVIRARGVGTDFDVASPETIAKHPYWQECLAPFGLRWFAGLKMTFGDQLWAVCLQRTIEQGPFLPEEVSQLRHLPQHLSAAGVLAQAMGYARADAAVAAFEASHRPVILLNKEGMVIRCNQSTEKLLGSDLQISGGRLLSSSAQATSKLHKSIRNLIWSLEPMRASAIVSLPRHETRPLLAYLTAPSEGIFDILGACHCIITLVDPNEVSIAEPSMLKQYFGLSPAEARIAADVGMGKMLPDVCATLHISYETGRSHLKSIFGKLGVHGQGELAALVTSLAERSPIEAGKGTSAQID